MEKLRLVIDKVTFLPSHSSTQLSLNPSVNNTLYPGRILSRKQVKYTMVAAAAARNLRKAARVILIGPPGAGKGTQSGRLLSHFKLSALSSGDILRDNVSIFLFSLLD